MVKYRKLDWFEERIGKTIYRGPTTCMCKDCAVIVKEGIEVYDSEHAYNLAMNSGELGVMYFDSKEELINQ